MAATWGMARRPLTPRQLELNQALANLRAAKGLLRAQQARVAAARQVVDALSRCDCCGVQVPPNGGEEELCFSCFRQRREQARLELLAQHGYSSDGKRLGQAASPA